MSKSTRTALMRFGDYSDVMTDNEHTLHNAYLLN